MGYVLVTVSSQVNDDLRNVERCIGFWDHPKDVKQRVCHSLAAIILDKINGLKSHQRTWTQTPTIPEKTKSQKSQEVRVEFQISIHIISCEVIIPVDFLTFIHATCHVDPHSREKNMIQGGGMAEKSGERDLGTVEKLVFVKFFFFATPGALCF